MNTLELNKTNKQLTSELNHHSPQSRRSRALAQALPTPQRRWNSSSHKPAFTIIEVVLVLAIAGLIFLMVFIALPALQRSQRDAQRKRDVDRALAAVQRYRTNNRSLPNGTVWNNILRAQYLFNGEESFRDPDGNHYYFYARPTGILPTERVPEDAAVSRILYTLHSRCTDTGNTESAVGNHLVSLQIVLESGGVYCVNN